MGEAGEDPQKRRHIYRQKVRDQSEYHLILEDKSKSATNFWFLVIMLTHNDWDSD